MSPSQTAYLTDKCEVQNNYVAGGKSVVAVEQIESGELIAVWSGRVVTGDDLDALSEDIRRHTVQVEENLYLSSEGPNEPPDYINHSCDPNCGLKGQITIVAMQTIRAGEEVTIDYAMCDGTAYDEFECACGAASCRGRVTGADWRNPSLWERYAGYFSPYLERRIAALRRSTRRRKRLVASAGAVTGNPV